MNTLPKTHKSYKNIYDVLTASIKSRILMSAVELGIFDETGTYKSAAEIAEALGTNKRNTEKLLNALTTIGLTEKHNGLFRNRSATAEFLAKESPTYMGAFLKTINKRFVDTLEGINKAVKNGPNTDEYENNFASEQLWSEVTRASAEWVKGHVGTQLADLVSRMPEFPAFRKMLDLGGGHGMFTLYFVDAHPDMRGTIFDRQAVLPVAEEFIAEYGMLDRISTIAGDYLNDELGNEYDFVWASATLNFARHDLDALFKKIYSSLNQGGVFISFQDGMTHEQTRPDIMLGHLGDSLQLDEDFYFDQGEIADAMLRCGFRSVRSRTIETPMGQMDLDIAKK